MTEATKVWASNSMMDPRVMVPIRIMPNDRSHFDLEPDESRHWAAVNMDYNEALIKDASVLPKVFTGFKLDTKLVRLPDFFMGGGFFIVSQKFADAFQKFDLGYGGFSPVTIYHGDRNSFISERQFYILYFGCQKQAFIPDLSNPTAFYRKTQVRGGYLRYSGPMIGDADSVLGSQALEGPDLWIDVTVAGSFFMSNRLVEAVNTAGLSKNMSLKKCKVIE
jgi:hypothetical protein